MTDTPVREHLFGDDRPFAQCHASTVAPLPGGRFAAAWFGGTREQHPDTAIWFALRSTEGWSAPRRLMKADDTAHWNPVLFADPAAPERLHLWFKTGAKIQTWRTWHAVSADAGATWSAPVPVAPDHPLPLGPVRNKPIVLADGSWLAGLSDEPPGAEPETWNWLAYTCRSEDRGMTWKDVAPVPYDCQPIKNFGSGLIQPALWESAPGRVHMLLRSTCGFICRSESTDGGRSWSRAVPTAMPNNNSGLDAARLDGGAVALVCNPVQGNWAARTPLTLFVSRDNGMTWPERLDLETEPGEYSYPAVVAVPGGAAVTYTWKRQRIAFWRGSVDVLRT